MFVGIISRQSSITSHFPQALLNYGPLIVQNKGFHSLSQRVFIRSLSNLMNMLVGIISRPRSITCQIPPGTLEFWPFNCSKTEIAVTASLLSKSNLLPSPPPTKKCCNCHWIYHKYDGRILCHFGALVYFRLFYL